LNFGHPIHIINFSTFDCLTTLIDITSNMLARVIEVLPPKPNRNDPLQIIKSRKHTHGRPATIAGPMVRYSKLPFRQTCRDYNIDIVYTPMMLAREFVRNAQARRSDFSTNETDAPTIIQVGVNNVTDLLRFIEMAAPYVDGVGINCGCPIKEQLREGIGCALIYNEELLVEMVKAVKEKYGDTLRLETKIRIHEKRTPERTLRMCKQLCEVGVDWITVHGRLRTTRSSEPVDLDAIKYIVDGLKEYDVPIVANGDCFTVKDMEHIAEYTGADGVMSARGVLSNPALFAGFDICPWGCVEKFVHYCIEFGGLPFQLVQHHIFCMFENMKVNKNHMKTLMMTKNMFELLDWLDSVFDMRRPDDKEFGERVEIPYVEV